MSYPSPLNINEICILAIGALDDIVIDFIEAQQLGASPKFLDWIADEATPFVESSVITACAMPRFVNSLLAGSPKIGITQWVRHWMRPLIRSTFPELSVSCGHWSEGSALEVKKLAFT